MKPPALLIVSLLLVGSLAAQGDGKPRKIGYDNTPMLPGQKWRVHDGTRPQPKKIEPATPSTDEKVGKAPSDAVVLFDGKDLSKWRSGKKEAKWKVEGGAMTVNRTGSIQSKEEFGDCQLHIEWRAPVGEKAEGQGKGNSGVFFFGRYEVQVLNSHSSQTYPDGQAAALYGQKPPDVNACRKEGEWQVYDIIFTRPRFAADGKVKSPAYVTVMHNGVVVQNHHPLIGATAHRKVAKYSKHGDKGPIQLQDHGNPVSYRNIWVRPLPAPQSVEASK